MSTPPWWVAALLVAAPSALGAGLAVGGHLGETLNPVTATGCGILGGVLVGSVVLAVFHTALAPR